MPSLLRVNAQKSAGSFTLRHTGLRFVALAAFTFVAVFAHAQKIDKIVVFGDSLSDTGNFTHVTLATLGIPIPSPIVDYTYGRFTDGFDTSPAAQAYQGVWVEQLAAMLPTHPAVTASLNGGTDYAYGDATAADGTTTTTFGPYSVTIDNVGRQITTYLATKPKIHKDTLFIVWSGANDLLTATSQQDVVKAAINEAIDIQRLIAAGGRNFIIPNLPPLGLIPRLNGSPYTSVPATQAAALFNQTLAQAIAVLHRFHRGEDLQLRQLDIFSLLEEIVVDPAAFGLTNITASSQAQPVVPDDYLFWDDLHPTTHGHELIALQALSLLNPEACREHARYEKDCESHEHANR